MAGELSAEQSRRIEAAKAEIRGKEREVTQAMARVQEKVAEPPFYGSMRKFGRSVDAGVTTELEKAVEELKAAMMVVVGNAEDLRGMTAAELVKVLTPVQAVKFLAAVARFQLQARKWGMENDFQRRRRDSFF